MGKIIAVCGKICSGKTCYSNKLKLKENAVILSCDELTSILFDNNLGDAHDEMSKKIWKYLQQKAVDIVKTNTNVILDWGFWSKRDRQEIREYFKSQNIKVEIHYIDIDEASWQKNISERNARVLEGKGGSDYYLDEGLMKKLLSKWEEPEKNEVDVVYKFKR